METNKIEVIKYPKMKHIKMLVSDVGFVEKHTHNDFEIIFDLKGKGKIAINDHDYLSEPGDIFLVNSNDPHSIIENESGVHKNAFLFVQISNHFLHDYFPLIRNTVFKSGNLKDFLNEDEHSSFSRQVLDAALSYFSNAECFHLDVVSIVAKVFSYLYREVDHRFINESQKEKTGRKKNRMERILSYIDENFDTQIRLEDIAMKERLSITHLSHIFSSNLGMTFQEFVNVKRMEQSIRLMANKEKTLLEISYESGFSDSKYMNRMFLKKFGCTPKEYRRDRLTHISNPLQEGKKREVIQNDSESLKAIEEYINHGTK